MVQIEDKCSRSLPKAFVFSNESNSSQSCLILTYIIPIPDRKARNQSLDLKSLYGPCHSFSREVLKVLLHVNKLGENKE